MAKRHEMLEFIEEVFVNRKAQKLPAGQVLFREGDVGVDLYVLLDGIIDITVAGTIVEAAGAGALVGEMALVDDQRRSATVITRTPCRVFVLSKADFDNLVHERPSFARYVLKIVVERLRRMDRALSANSHQGSARPDVPGQQGEDLLKDVAIQGKKPHRDHRGK